MQIPVRLKHTHMRTRTHKYSISSCAQQPNNTSWKSRLERQTRRTVSRLLGWKIKIQLFKKHREGLKPLLAHTYYTHTHTLKRRLCRIKVQRGLDTQTKTFGVCVRRSVKRGGETLPRLERQMVRGEEGREGEGEGRRGGAGSGDSVGSGGHTHPHLARTL